MEQAPKVVIDLADDIGTVLPKAEPKSKSDRRRSSLHRLSRRLSCKC